MRNYLKMKKNEWKIKAAFYGAIADLMENRKEILDLLQRMYHALKDVPAEELQREMVSALADAIHRDNEQSREA